MKQIDVSYAAIRVLYSYFEHIENSEILKLLTITLTNYSAFDDLIHRRTDLTETVNVSKFGKFVHHLTINTRFSNFYVSMHQLSQFPNIETVTLNIWDSSIEIIDIEQYQIQNLEIITEWPLSVVFNNFKGRKFRLSTRQDYASSLLREMFFPLSTINVQILDIYIYSTSLSDSDLYKLYSVFHKMPNLKDLKIGNLSVLVEPEFNYQQIPVKFIDRYTVTMSAEEILTNEAFQIIFSFHAPIVSVGYYPHNNFYVRSNDNSNALIKLLNRKSFDTLILEIGSNEFLYSSYEFGINVLERFPKDMAIGSSCQYKYPFDLSSLECQINKLIVISDGVLRFPKNAKIVEWHWKFGWAKFPKIEQFSINTNRIKLVGHGIDRILMEFSGFERKRKTKWDMEYIQLHGSLCQVEADTNFFKRNERILTTDYVEFNRK